MRRVQLKRTHCRENGFIVSKKRFQYVSWIRIAAVSMWRLVAGNIGVEEQLGGSRP
jgi:hypothetical protein